MRIRHRIHLAARGGLIASLVLGLIGGPAQAGTENQSQTITINDLEWVLASNGKNIRFPEAVEYCAELNFAGHTDWRLPTLDELEKLHDPDAESGEGIRSPFSIGDCCLWSGDNLAERPAPDGDEIGGTPEMYHWGYMFDGGFPYYAVYAFDDGRALCTRDAGESTE